jgi:hypothetical protein
MKVVITRDLNAIGDICAWYPHAKPELDEEGKWDAAGEHTGSWFIGCYEYDEFYRKYNIEIKRGKKRLVEGFTP